MNKNVIVCKKCGEDVYIQQRTTNYILSITYPYYCWSCEDFRNYSEVETGK